MSRLKGADEMTEGLRTVFTGSGGVNFVTNLVNLTRSKKDNPETEFCDELKGRNIQAIDFDKVKESVCRFRLPAGEKQLFYCSVDALLMTRDGSYCFVEFKNSTKKGLLEIDNDTCESLKKSLWKKAFDSIALAGLTIAPDGVSGQELMSKSILCVVCRDCVDSAFDRMNAKSAFDFEFDLSRKHTKETITEEQFADWDLDEFKDRGLYKDVRVDTECDFVNWARENLTNKITGLG